MTSGSSQGLFVIVAVVIFGIFVLISYILFRDNLKTGLGDIFEDAIEETNNVFKKENLLSDEYFKSTSGFWKTSHLAKLEKVTYASENLPKDKKGNPEIFKITRDDSDYSKNNYGYFVQHLKDLPEGNRRFETGTKVTISARVYIPEEYASEQFRIGLYDTDSSGKWLNGQTVNLKHEKSWHTVTTTLDISTDLEKIFVVGFGDNIYSTIKSPYFFVSKMKLEHGNKFTGF